MKSILMILEKSMKPKNTGGQGTSTAKFMAALICMNPKKMRRRPANFENTSTSNSIVSRRFGCLAVGFVLECLGCRRLLVPVHFAMADTTIMESQCGWRTPSFSEAGPLPWCGSARTTALPRTRWQQRSASIASRPCPRRLCTKCTRLPIARSVSRTWRRGCRRFLVRTDRLLYAEWHPQRTSRGLGRRRK